MTAATDSPRKPRIALMGEFSAGKSTLSNLLLGAKPLPEKVTATRLSPVWMSHGTQAPYRIDMDGTTEFVSLEHLEEVPVEETRAIRLFFESDILEICDLIDFPGISDPNMDAEVWERLLTEVDAVFWCTHATQAWRQSEAAVWDTIPQSVKDRSTLLITRFDKITNDHDRSRVLARVNMEVEGQFQAVYPISLIQALAAADDPDLWESSGAASFFEHMIDRILKLGEDVAQNPAALIPTAPVAPVSSQASQATESNISDLLSSFELEPASDSSEQTELEDDYGVASVEPRLDTDVLALDALHKVLDTAEDSSLIHDTAMQTEVEVLAVPEPAFNTDDVTEPQDSTEIQPVGTPDKVSPRRVAAKHKRVRSRRPERSISGDMMLQELEREAAGSASSSPETPTALRSVFSGQD